MVTGAEHNPSWGRQDISAGRDAYAARRDLTVHHHHAASERPAADGPVLVGDLPQQPPGFQSRAELLAALDEAGPRVVVRAVTGMRGVGKTQLAAAYARAKAAAGWRLVAWVNAEDAASVAAGLAAVAEAAGLVGQGTDPGRAVRRWLEAHGEQCLVVFDNATDADVLRPYVPAAGASRVLVTSNRQSMMELGEPLEVEVFTPGEAVAFLTERTGLADRAEAGALAGELGFLPLALAQAAAVIRSQRLGYGTYLERLRALPVAGLLARGPGQPYPHGTAEAVLLSLQAVQNSDRSGACAAVMGMLSVLSAAGVRRDLVYAAGQHGILADGSQVEPVVVDEVLGRLAEASLLAFTVDGQAVLAHRLVLRVVRERFAQQGRLAAVCWAAAIVLDARAGSLTGSLDRPAVRDIPEQVAALQQTIAGLAGKAGELETSMLRLRLWAVCHLHGLGDSARQAIAVGGPLLEDSEKILGAGHPATLAARGNLANAYQQAGLGAEAIPLLERTLADMERVLSPDHPDTLIARFNLANGYRVTGWVSKAIPLLERALADQERLLGLEHPDTLRSRNNLAAAYQDAGRVTEAIGLHERAVADRERVLDPDHPDTLQSRNDLAAAYQMAGRAAEAIELLERTLADRERVLDPDHPDTLQSRNNLAAAYQLAGRLTEAIELHEHALTHMERLLGPDHPNTLASQNNLAVAYQDAGRAAEAIRLHERTLADRERVLGPDHPHTLQSRNNLAAACQVTG